MIRAPFIDFGGSSDIRRHSPDVWSEWNDVGHHLGHGFLLQQVLVSCIWSLPLEAGHRADFNWLQFFIHQLDFKHNVPWKSSPRVECNGIKIHPIWSNVDGLGRRVKKQLYLFPASWSFHHPDTISSSNCRISYSYTSLESSLRGSRWYIYGLFGVVFMVLTSENQNHNLSAFCSSITEHKINKSRTA